VLHEHGIPHFAKVVNLHPGRDRTIDLLPCSTVSHVALRPPVAVFVQPSCPPATTEEIFLYVLTDDDALHTVPLPMQTICISTPFQVPGVLDGVGSEVPCKAQRVSEENSPTHAGRLLYEHMFDTVATMRFEVDVFVQHPLDEQAERFLSSVQRSANRVIRFRGDDRRIVVTVEAHAYDRDGAVRAAIQEVAHIYPLMKFGASGEPRPIGT